MTKIIGHENLISDLKNLAKENRLSHGYIFFGPPRVGKKLVALSLANFLENNDFSPPENKVLSDLLLIVPDDMNTVGIDRIRDIRSFLWQMPNRSAYRTVVIEGGEFLTTEAQNALLKITEEPSSSALIILVLDDPERLRPTLESRLQKIYFPAVDRTTIKKWLVQELHASESRAEALSLKSLGQPGLAFKMFKDERFQELQMQVKKFLGAGSAERKNFIKELAADDKFEPDKFLEVLAIDFRATGNKNLEFWHALMGLRRNMDYFNLNPRLQLTALAGLLEK